MVRKNTPAVGKLVKIQALILLALAFVPALSGSASSGGHLQLSSAANGLRCFEATPPSRRCALENTRAVGLELGAIRRGGSGPARWVNHCHEGGSDRAEGQGLAGALYLRGGGQEEGGGAEEDESSKVLPKQSR